VDKFSGKNIIINKTPPFQGRCFTKDKDTKNLQS